MKLVVLTKFWTGEEPSRKYLPGMVIDDADVPAGHDAASWIERGLVRAEGAPVPPDPDATE